jgi:hypothetical protein
MDLEQLKKLIRYDPETGMTFWLERGQWVVSDGLQTDDARKRFNAKYAGEPCLTTFDKDGYLSGCVLGKFYRAHRVAFALHHGRWPDHTVDHLNKDRTDNRAKNLRDATRVEQQANRNTQRNNKSGVPGVHFCKIKGAWVARKTVNSKRVLVGVFKTKIQAIAAKREFSC